MQLSMVRRYLWAQGSVSVPLPPGTLLAGRYQVLDFPLLRDTTPAAPPVPLDAVPDSAAPYLALSPFSIAIPRPFTQVTLPETGEALLLLEEIPLQQVPGETQVPSLLPALAAAWERASALQQISWLWQVAQLWQPCVDTQTAVSLLDGQNVRVEGEDIRLLCLQVSDQPVTLADLGQQWRSLLPAIAPSLSAYFTALTDRLCAGQGTPAGLLQSLTQALEALAAAGSVAIEWVTYSDQGPSRQRNEDACYPPSGTAGHTVLSGPQWHPTLAPLLVVCDGVGGHQGGDIASQLAIATVTEHLRPLTARSQVSHRDVVSTLEQALRAANDRIASQNDAGRREDRDRMGTTLVLALVYGARLYIAHLGDSRAYRVRSHSCRQMTLDDDVAAREMRLGLDLYPQALQAPGSGALVQALGMAASQYLHPTIAMYPVTTASVILLCSDGLSDHALVDRLWAAELLPVLQGHCPVAVAGQRLIELANTHNGHDNVTVALLKVAPAPGAAPPPIPAAWAQALTAPAPALPSTPRRVSPGATQLMPPAPVQRRSWPWFLLLGMAAIGGLAGIFTWQGWRQRTTPVAPAPANPSGATLSPTARPPRPDLGSRDGSLAVGDFLQIRQLQDPTAAATLIMTDSPPAPPPPAAVDLPVRLLAIGSIVQVVSRQKTPDNQLWVRLRVCSVPSSASVAATVPAPAATDLSPAEENIGDRALPLTQPGEQGWLLETDLPFFADQLLDTSPTQPGLCTD